MTGFFIALLSGALMSVQECTSALMRDVQRSKNL